MRNFKPAPSRKHGILSILLIICLITTPLMVPQTALAADYPLPASNAVITNALDWMHDQQSADDGSIGGFSTSAWVVMAIAAAGQNPHNWRKDDDPANPSIIDYLENNAGTATSATDYARVILAITAAGRDPTNFGGRDFVTLLKGCWDGTKIGNGFGDGFWAIMALISAGESPSSTEVVGTVNFIKNNQSNNGGWGWAAGQSDVDDTAAAIMALISAGESASSPEITNGLTYMKEVQDIQDTGTNGGFDSGWGTNADTDSWAICAIKASGQNPNGTNWTVVATPIDDLTGFQQLSPAADTGAFYWQSGDPGFSPCQTTACAIIALLGKYYPVRIAQSNSSTISNEDLVRSASIETAAQAIESLPPDEAALLLEKISKERTGQILDAVSLEQRTGIISEMSQTKLAEILPELSPEKLFEIPAQQLFELLPESPTEQLSGEVVPDTCTNSLQAGITEISNTANNITLQTNKIEANEWVDFLSSVSPLSNFSTNSPFTSLMLKTKEEIDNAKITINQFQTKPAGVNSPSGYPYLGLYYKIDLKNIIPDNISASRMVFRLNKDILSFMQHNKWSVLLNRWDETTQSWMTIATKRITEENGFVYYSAAVPEYSVFCITGEAEIPKSECSVSALSITPQEAVSGDVINITADVSNQSTEIKNYTATLWINQMIEQTQKITVPPGKSTSVSFSLTKNKTGEYQVRIDRLAGTFIVSKQPDTTSPDITDLSPLESISDRNPLVSASFNDSGDGIDINSMELILDNENITAQSEITETSIVYHPTHDIAPGEHHVRLTITDRAGNNSIKEWSFVVSELPSLPGCDTSICDPDKDGLYEDINGNGKFDLYDIAFFNDNIHSENIQNNDSLFDFNRDGMVDYNDTLALLAKMYKELALSH